MDSAQERPPYEAYAVIAGSFAGLLATAGALGRLLDRDPQCQTALDFADAHDEVPVRSGGMQQALGELVTCTRCVGTWTAAGLASTQIVAPRVGRLLTWSLGAAGANDFLQAGFTALKGKANEPD
jgi:hypothetical protein